MCQLATFIFSNPGPPTNLLLQVTKDEVRDRTPLMTCRFKSTLVGAWMSSGPCPRPFTFYSRGAYSQSGPHQQSIRYQNFDQVGIEFQSGWDWILIRPEHIVP
jgi:hypothetical protein